MEEWPRPDKWDESLREYDFTLTVPFDQELLLMAKAYNGFDLYTESNRISLSPIPDPERLEAEAEAAREKSREALRRAQKNYEEIHYESLETEPVLHGSVPPFWQIALIIGLILLLMVLLSFFTAKMIFLLRRNNKRR